MGTGYIKLYRQIQDCWIWRDEENPEKFSKGQAWIDLLLLANHKEKKIRYENDFRMIERGQFLTSKRKLAERWMWNRRTVDRFLELLEKDGMIATECTTKSTLITIVNYSIFQNSDSESEPPSTPRSAPHTTPRSAPPSSTNNNVINKECKNVNNIPPFIPQTVEKKKSESASVDEIEKMLQEKNYSNAIDSAIREWLDYKKEKKQTYKPKGLSAFLTRIDKELKKHSEQNIIDLMHLCMERNYQGLIWDLMKEVTKVDANSGNNQSSTGKYDDFAQDYFKRHGVQL